MGEIDKETENHLRRMPSNEEAIGAHRKLIGVCVEMLDRAIYLNSELLTHLTDYFLEEENLIKPQSSHYHLSAFLQRNRVETEILYAFATVSYHKTHAKSDDMAYVSDTIKGEYQSLIERLKVKRGLNL